MIDVTTYRVTDSTGKITYDIGTGELQPTQNEREYFSAGYREGYEQAMLSRSFRGWDK